MDVIGEKKYCFVVCYSYNLAEQNPKTLERNIEKEKSETNKEAFWSKIKGRRKKDETPKTEKVYTFQYELVEDKNKINQRKEEIGMFVLIINELKEENLSNKELLMEYKNQNSVESTFKILKSPSYVDSIFLNKPEIIEAFGYVMVLAVLVMN